jgi:undecaprenyl-diphosphatase
VSVAAAAILGFLWLAYAVAHGMSQDFDLAVREAIHSRAVVPLTYAMQTATQLGGAYFLFGFGAVVVAFLLRSDRAREAALFTIAALGAEAVNETMKLVFHRPRPEAYFGYPSPVSYSFPSGHSLVSYCFYLALAEILIEPEWPMWRKLAVWIAAGFLVLLIGFSRVYLGVHYPTDVIGGYLAAVAWAAVLRAAHHRWWD